MLSRVDLLLADWVFGYGSLIWNPEIDYERAVLARAHGYHRAFCISSSHYRGTAEAPGVVLGLDRGGSCIGLAFRLHHAGRRRAIEHLYAREMLGDVYVPTLAAITLAGGMQVRALTFVANRASADYRLLPEAEVLRRLACCAGQRGPNREYAVNTLHALQAHGVHDARLARLVHQLLARGHGDGRVGGGVVSGDLGAGASDRFGDAAPSGAGRGIDAGTGGDRDLHGEAAPGQGRSTGRPAGEAPRAQRIAHGGRADARPADTKPSRTAGILDRRRRPR
jgi:cation transport protein ChaC